MGFEKVFLCFLLNTSEERGALEAPPKSFVCSLWDRRAKWTVCGGHSGNVEDHVRGWGAALRTEWECGCAGIDLYADFVGAKDECLPWTRCGLQRRWNKSQAEAYESPDQKNRWEANELLQREFTDCTSWGQRGEKTAGEKCILNATVVLSNIHSRGLWRLWESSHITKRAGKRRQGHLKTEVK